MAIGGCGGGESRLPPVPYGNLDDSSERMPADLNAMSADWGPTGYVLDEDDRPSSPMINQAEEDNEVVGGDERRFLAVRDADEDADFVRNLTITEDGSYQGYIYFNNGADPDSAETATRDARVSLKIPEEIKDRKLMSATIRAANSWPPDVYSSVTLETPLDSFRLGVTVTSAKLWLRGGEESIDMPVNELLSDRGALLGCANGADGIVGAGHSCWGFVTFEFSALESIFSTDVRAGAESIAHFENSIFVEDIRAYDVLARYYNLGDIPQQNVAIRPVIPPGMAYITGSLHYSTDQDTTDVRLADDDLQLDYPFGERGAGTAIYYGYKLIPTADWLTQFCKIGDVKIQSTVTVGAGQSTAAMPVFYDKTKC